MKIKHSHEDKLFSLYIRNKAKGICEYCKKFKGVKKLQASHFVGRRNKSLRWDEENVSALCFHCHMVIMTENPHKHSIWMRKKLGEEKYWALIQRGNEIKKWTKDELKDLRETLRKKLKKME